MTLVENFEGGKTTTEDVSATKPLSRTKPTTARAGWAFIGWFTEAEGGEQVLTPEDGATYYAHWTESHVITIGSGTGTGNNYLPTYTFCNYSLTQQIYTSDEIGGTCTINSIAFKNVGVEKTRTLDIYLVHTDKDSFSGSADWIAATVADKVFSGEVTFTSGDWTTIPLDAPFAYNGTDNLAVIVDDNSGRWESGMSCLAFDASHMAIRVYSDGTNYDPASPSSYSGSIMDVKNQIQLGISTLEPELAVVTFVESEYVTGEPDTVNVVVNGGSAAGPSSVKVYMTYQTAAAADLDLTKGMIDEVMPKGGLKFPLTLAWDTGDTNPKTISIPIKADKTVENLEFFTLQLADAIGAEVGETDICTVSIQDANDKTLKAAVTAYKPKKGETVTTNSVTVASSNEQGGFVAGTGYYASGSKLTLTAETRPGWAFVGWWRTSDNQLLSTKAKWQIVVNSDDEYVAVFEEIPYMRALAAPADGGKTTGSGYCALGKKVTLKATVNKGFTFVGWTDNLLGDTLVATTPSLVIDRTAKPAKDSKTSTTLTNITESTTFYAVFAGDPRVTVTPVAFNDQGVIATQGGKVTGAGRYAAGKNVTLKATANKGFAFGGWYPAEGGNILSQAPNFTFAMPEADADLYARFVTLEEDMASITLAVSGEGAPVLAEETPAVINYCGVAVAWPLEATALSATTVKAAGLPTGVKLVQDKVTKAYSLVGAPTAASKLDAKTGAYVPSKVKLTVTTAGKSSQTYAFDWTILPLPLWAVGTFNGGGETGQATLTVTQTGKISGKWLEGGLTWTLAADSFNTWNADEDIYFATLVGKSGKEAVTNTVAFGADVNGGVAVAAGEVFVAYQNNWKYEPWKTLGKGLANTVYAYETEDADGNAGTVTLKLQATGGVTVAARFVTGEDAKTGKEIVYSASGSAVLCPRPDGKYQTFIYLPPKAGKFSGYVECVTVEE